MAICPQHAAVQYDVESEFVYENNTYVRYLII